MKIIVVILVVVSLGLAAGLVYRHHEASTQLKVAARENSRLASQWEETRQQLDEQRKVTALLETNLSQRSEELVSASNSLTTVQSELFTAQQEVKAAQAEVEKRETRIAQLEEQRDDLSKKLDELSGSINTLEVQIAETKKKLASAEGNRDYLMKELTRLQTEKSELVRQFNDLSTLRAQVAKLRDEAAINQRLDWIQRGIYSQREKKGAQMLLSRVSPTRPSSERHLNVEFYQEGGVKGADGTTNAPVNP